MKISQFQVPLLLPINVKCRVFPVGKVCGFRADVVRILARLNFKKTNDKTFLRIFWAFRAEEQAIVVPGEIYITIF